MEVVTLDRVTKCYGAAKVVDNFSMAIVAGEIVALLGPTGAGKSTIMNMIMGQTEPTTGDVRVHNLHPRKDSKALRGLIAVSFQSDRLLPWRTADQNVALGLQYLGVGKSERNRTAREWLERVKLEPLHHSKYPHQLSGGMRQRVALARALAINPELILLDESFSQLDHSTSEVLRRDFVLLVREFNKTCLLITHRIEDAVEMADRVIVIGTPGRIKFEIAIDQRNTCDADRERIRKDIYDKISEDTNSAMHT
jgi:NitT/TauT family transport system ATP-binding protein